MAVQAAQAAAARLPLAVCGLHLTGQPLNSQLMSLGARLLSACRSSADYRLYAIRDLATGITKPGMVRVTDGSGAAISLEVWDLPTENVGAFIRQIKAPLGIGSVQLEDGNCVHGFICEGYIAQGGPGIEDITHLGGWVAYLSRTQA